MNKKSSKIITIILLIAVLLIGCSNNTTNINNITNSINQEQLISELQSILYEETNIQEEYKYISSNINIELEDKMKQEDIIINNTYTSNNAIYIQVNYNQNEFMYRFQLTDTLVTSYIKYKLEG